MNLPAVINIFKRILLFICRVLKLGTCEQESNIFKS